MSEAQALTLSAGNRRLVKDKLARYGVTLGGTMVLVALLLIFFYLLYVVAPIFRGAHIEQQASYALPGEGSSLYLGIEEKNEIAYRLTDRGQMVFFRAQDLGEGKPAGEVLDTQSLLEGTEIVQVAQTMPVRGELALATADGRVKIIKPDMDVSFPNNVRQLTPVIEYPLEDRYWTLDPKGQAPSRLAFEHNDEGAMAASYHAGGRLVLTRFVAEENFITEEVEWSQEHVELQLDGVQVGRLLLTPDLRRLFVQGQRRVLVYDVSDIDEAELEQVLDVTGRDVRVTDMTLLSGGSSLLVGDSLGKVSQWFQAATPEGRKFVKARQFQTEHAVSQLAAELYRKTFVAAQHDGHLALFHATGETELLSERLVDGQWQLLNFSPRASALIAQVGDQIRYFAVENEHPEVSWQALWGEIWYEGYEEPDYIWQSTSASDDFEPKLSLVPISFGTIKAAFYAMLFATPLALAGAIYTAYFMSPGMRKVVKPTVEIMEALPTVILGFLAGLWLAPLLEENLPGVLALLLIMPLAILCTAFAWHKMPQSIRHKLPEGWDAIILLPVLLLVGWLCFAISPALEQWFFDGNARLYLTNELGIDFDQRNSLVVGIAMGFAVIPTIFSIAEDAVFSVPKHLTQGSLALGATPWQTLSRVVLLTASPGIFSAVMMGLGRAVGETMIVLMATGNTPIMDWNIFEGMRTLSANIAVEMPESEVGSSHYRVLFLAAFVLFVFTFFFNTVAEFVRQRLRDKYSSM
ncbi:ABC transporter permease subunit [Gallaecimonas sp. GXIMD4217]|uniref:ABC transporter permease subunit n=1 Tax=Gallaecimonas sp. GXIMD4217 TaxID=3131927 RepID=UPI00311AC8C9